MDTPDSKTPQPPASKRKRSPSPVSFRKVKNFLNSSYSGSYWIKLYASSSPDLPKVDTRTALYMLIASMPQLLVWRFVSLLTLLC